MNQEKVEFPFIKLAPLFEFVRYELRPVETRQDGDVWLRVPSGLPMFPTVRLSKLLTDWIKENMLYQDVVDKNYYLEAREYGKGRVMLSVQYQQILGRRALCVVPLSELKAALGPVQDVMGAMDFSKVEERAAAHMAEGRV